MKIEAEVEPSAVYAFHQGGGCSEPSAQEQRRSASIDRPAEWQQPGCGGGCGPPASSSSSASDDHNNIGSNSVPPSSALFDCEHFQFIDDDEDDDDPVRSHDEDDAPPGEEDMAAPATAPPPPGGQLSEDMGESESVAAKRQASSLDEAAPARPRSVLKRTSGSSSKRPRNNHRVTFDEAVTLYSGESEDGVQTLALTTGPDIVYTDVFYTFEPPIEYQDVPPFEPPAEYRDSSDDVPPQPQPDAYDSCQQTEEEPDLPETSGVRPDSADEQTGEQQTPDPVADDADRSDVAVSQETEPTDSAAADEPLAHRPDGGRQQESSSSLESDELFERFLEAEREFAVDEELNNVFHALEADFSSDDKNGALDDNFFRKLISLLSSAEGGDASSDGTSDYFSEPNLAKWQSDLDDDNSQAHSRTLSEADSDCSISSQDTIIVRFGEEDGEQATSGDSSSSPFPKASEPARYAPDSDSSDAPLSSSRSEGFDEVFTEVSESSSADERPRPIVKSNHVAQAVAKLEKANGESLSRQSSGEQSVNSQDPPQDADDSTSSDSRSGEVEEEIRLDDIGYDEEDAEDYDEESFRGMAHGNSKIRRIIKKNALQCTLFRGMEAKRRQQPGAKYPRPKSPLLSQESLVEKLKWLTTIDEHKDADGAPKFHSKPPDVILSTGGVPVNGSMPHSASSEDDQAAQGFQQQSFYQQRHVPPPNSGAAYYVRRDGFPPTHHPSLPRQRVAYPPQTMVHTLPHPQNRVVAHPSNSQQVQWCEQQQQRPSAASMTVPRNFRDWRIIQRITGTRNSDGGHRSSPVAADYVRCPNGGVSAFPVPPDVQGRPGKDELEQFVEKDSRRLDMIRKRYSVAEEEDDPTFGFARRPSVRGVQNRIQSSSNPSDNIQGHANKAVDPYAAFALEEPQGPALVHPRSAYPGEQVRIWSRDPNWRPDPSQPLYGPPLQGGRSQVPLHIHRASVALTELPGSATIPYTHRKPHPDPRYHSYAESMYGSTRTLPTQGGWDPRLCPVVAHETFANMPAVSLQVPPHSKDERGVPEGASSSPKISSDSLYPVPDAIASTGGPHKEDGGIIYYSLNV